MQELAQSRKRLMVTRNHNQEDLLSVYRSGLRERHGVELQEHLRKTKHNNEVKCAYHCNNMASAVPFVLR